MSKTSFVCVVQRNLKLSVVFFFFTIPFSQFIKHLFINKVVLVYHMISLILFATIILTAVQKKWIK